MIDTLVPPTIGIQEAVVVAAEGIDKFGKGVLQVSMDFATTTASCEKDSMTGDRTFRAPIDALEAVGFGHAAEVRCDRF